MGPAATADFYAKLVRATPAATDQQHLRVVIWADPTTPDRTLALLENGPDPTPWLIHGANVLKAAGADMIAVPCNTAHAFLPAVAEQVGVPIVHMIDQVARYLLTRSPPVREIGLLATTGTLRADLYQDWLGEAGIKVHYPDTTHQETEVMPAIRAIKAGNAGPNTTRTLVAAANRLIDQGAEVIIAGCTEIPLGLPAEVLPVPLIDPSQVLANAVVALAHRHPAETTPAHNDDQPRRAKSPKQTEEPQPNTYGQSSLRHQAPPTPPHNGERPHPAKTPTQGPPPHTNGQPGHQYPAQTTPAHNGEQPRTAEGPKQTQGPPPNTNGQ
jgi:aspartate racemase